MSAVVARRAAAVTAASRPAGDRDASRRSVTAAPTLVVVPRRRRAAWFATVLSVVVVGLMLAAAVLHTRLAERQLRIDRLEQAVVVQRERFDVLRQHRAELRSPSRLASEAQRLGMQPAAVSEFATIDPMTVAIAIAAAGALPSREAEIRALEPLDQFRLVKEVGAGAP
jgi:hypothetical protein